MKPRITTVRLVLMLPTIVFITVTGACAFALQKVTTIPTSFRIELLIPEGYRFNSRAPSSLTLGSPEATSEQVEIKDTSFDVTISIPTTPQFSIAGDARVFFCDDSAEPQCYMKQVSFKKDYNKDTPRVLQVTIPNPKMP